MSGHDTSACAWLLEDAAVAVLTREPLPAPVLAHLDGCPACRDEVAAMASLPARLALARDSRLVEEVRPSPALLPRLLREVHHRRVQRRWITLGAAAAAATIAVGTTLGVELVRSGQGTPAAVGISATRLPVGPSSSPSGSSPSGSSPSGSSQVTEPAFATGEGTDRVTGASAEVTVLAADWGSHIRIEVYDVPANTQCRLVVVDRRGRRAEAGSWNVTQTGYRASGQTFTEAVAVRPQDVAMVELVDNRTQRKMIQITVVRV